MTKVRKTKTKETDQDVVTGAGLTIFYRSADVEIRILELPTRFSIWTKGDEPQHIATVFTSEPADDDEIEMAGFLA